MRNFQDIRDELSLSRFLASPLGTLYEVPIAPGAPNWLVRHFDGALSPDQVGAYVALWTAMRAWLEKHAELGRFVDMEEPALVGQDFVAREHHVYYTSTVSYVESDDPPEPPPQLERMRRAFENARDATRDDADALLAKIWARSLLDPSDKTYFRESRERFMVLEPKCTPEEVKQWAQLDHDNA